MDSDQAHRPAIHLAGQSLGTGVAARLALDLHRVGESKRVLDMGMKAGLLTSDHEGEAPGSLFLLAPYTSIRKLLTSYKLGGLLPVFWPLGLWKVLSDMADKHLHTRFESEKALYQLVKGPSTLDAEETKQWGGLDFTLKEAALAEELGVSPINDRRSLPPNIVISHADDDAVIPHAHGRSLLDTIASALSRMGTEQEIEEEKYSWGCTLTLLDAETHRSYVLVKSRKGGHNGIPRHALKVFSSVAGLAPPSSAHV